MAVIQGTRLRSGTLPPAPAPSVRLRAATPAATPVVPRMRPMGLLMAGIVAGTLLGLVYLTQTLGSNASSSELGTIQRDRAALLTEINRHATLVLELSDGDAIQKGARKHKLRPLGDPLILSAP